MVRPILEGARRRFQVAAAEVGLQDKWQRAVLGFASVSPGGDGHAGEVLGKVRDFVWSFPEVDVLDAEQSTFAWDG